MPNYRDVTVPPSKIGFAVFPDELYSPILGHTSIGRNSRLAGSSFPKAHFNYLKKISGRLTRLLRGESLVPKEPAVQHLLIVDDEQSIRFSMSEYFSQHGFKVDTAREIEEAEKLIESTNYQVVIQDLRLGFTLRNEGLEIIKMIHQRNPETRIVVLTSYGSTEIEAEARRSGADAFLQKPKRLSQVAQVVQGLIEDPRKRTTPLPGVK
jgi:ActR/RegA family two-component response regulator